MTATASVSRATARPDRVERQADRVVLGLVPAGADRDVEPAAGQDVERREVLGEDRRVAQVVVVDERRDPERRRRGGDRREVRDRGERARDEVIRDRERRDADRTRRGGRARRGRGRPLTSEASAMNEKGFIRRDCRRVLACVRHHCPAMSTGLRWPDHDRRRRPRAVCRSSPTSRTSRSSAWRSSPRRSTCPAGADLTHEGRYEGPVFPSSRARSRSSATAGSSTRSGRATSSARSRRSTAARAPRPDGPSRTVTSWR